MREELVEDYMVTRNIMYSYMKMNSDSWKYRCHFFTWCMMGVSVWQVKNANIKRRWSVESNITMSSATDTVRDNTLDEAMFRSWNKRKKEYQDEIQRLRNKVSGYWLKLDAVQKQVLSGEIRWQGRNKTKSKESFNRYQHSNGDIISSFCKNKMFPQYKFLQPSYVM